MKAYPGSFVGWLWLLMAAITLTGLVLLPGLFALRLEWDVPGAWLPPARSQWAAAHGLVAFAVMVLWGSLLPLHVRHGLRQQRNRRSGIAMLALLPLFILSGWAIYYLGDEDWSRRASLLHVIVVVPAALMLAIHAWQARRIHAQFGSRHQR